MFLLQFRNELWKLFGKKRTYIGFGAFLVTQNAMLLTLHFSNWRRGAERMLEGNGYFGAEFISALTVSVIMLVPQILLLMPLYATLVGGDMVAKEAEDGTLRMILARPISRLRLLFLKWLSGVVFCVLLVAVLGVTALLFARCWFPWKGMFVFVPGYVFNVLDPAAGWRCYALAQVFLAVNASVMFSLAFMFSCFNMKPAAATIVALSYLFLNAVMDVLPFLENFQQWFLIHHFRAWLRVFNSPVDWPAIAESECVLVGVMITTFIIGAAAFQVRDIKS